MAAGDRGRRGRREYSSGDRRRGSRYRDRKTAERRREEYKSSGQAARDAQRKKEQAERRERERRESERRIREAQEKRQREEKERREREEAERKAREEAEKQRKQQVAAEQQTEEEQRRAAVTGEEEEGRGLWDRLTSLFDGDEEGEQIKDEEGNVVAEAFTVDKPTNWSSLDFGEGVGYEEPEEEGSNPYEGYAKTVIDQGSIGETEEEKEAQRRILRGGKEAVAADAASALGGIVGGPIGAGIGAGVGLADEFAEPEEGSPEEAGRRIYESGKTGLGALGGIASGLGVPGVGTALDAADIAFGSSKLEDFRVGAGLPGEDRPQRPDYGRDNGATSGPSTPSAPRPPTQTPSTPTPTPTMADSFSFADWDQNLYSRYLQQFFNQGA